MRATAAIALAVATTSLGAAADDVPLQIDAHGRPFRVAPLDPDATLAPLSRTCDGPCVLRLPSGRYRVTIAEETEDLRLEQPTKLRYDPGHPTFRLAGGALAAGGIMITGFTLYAAVKFCDSTDPDCRSRFQTAQYVLVGAAGVGLAMAVIGGIVFFSAGPSIFVDGPTKPAADQGVPLAFVAPTKGGAILGLAGKF